MKEGRKKERKARRKEGKEELSIFGQNLTAHLLSNKVNRVTVASQSQLLSVFKI